MIGIIGGSGLDDPKLLKNAKDVEVDTAYGKPTSPLRIGELNGKKVCFIARHGRKHQIMPSNVNFRANIWALKDLGVKQLLATTACGSLREEIMPSQIVFPDQFIDWTSKRSSTFFDKEEVCHIPMADPFCPKLRKSLIEAARKLKIDHHKKGTVVTIEGPRFSTRAESHMFKNIGGDIINMSTVPEVVLAREAGICYQAIAMVTDYDCFLEDRQAVTIDEVLKVMKQNAENVKKLLLESVSQISKEQKRCQCSEHIKTAIIRD